MKIFIKTQKNGSAANTFFEGIINKSEKDIYFLDFKNKNIIYFIKLVKKVNFLINKKKFDFTIINDFGFVKNLLLLLFLNKKSYKFKIYTTYYHHIFTFKECFIYFQFNELWKFFSLKFYYLLEKFIKIKNIKFITVSNFTRKNMINNFSVDPRKIIVIWNQIMDLQIIKKIPLQKIDLKSESYILIISTLVIRKNILLIQKLANIYEKKIKFVCPYPKNISEKRKLNKLIKNNVCIFHNLDDENLKALYLNASCVLIPSLYEGLSLIPLESINLSKPIIMSNIEPHLHWRLPKKFYFDINNFDDILKKLNFYLNKGNSFVDYSTFKDFKDTFSSAIEERKQGLKLIYNTQDY